MDKSCLYALQLKDTTGFVSLVNFFGEPEVMESVTVDRACYYYWYQIAGLREVLKQKNIAFRAMPIRKYNPIRKRYERID